ncbi:unnamed protein product [Adineta steineri]|uniref:Major facilitator superfamily (MFS) profile domain-containing protein n=2 Tax=Adineta steineri TaxID=433720 RepID=A0A819UVT9_9BILA|nr:unnamed protein product [Adineta steineri]
MTTEQNNENNNSLLDEPNEHRRKTVKRRPIVPDGGWGWVIVFSSFMIHFIMDGITYSMGDIYLEPMLSSLKLNRGYVSIIFAFLESITLAAAPISTVFTNTFGSRKITIVGAVLASLGFFLSRLWTNIYYYYVTIGLIAGIGCGLMYLPAIVSVGYYFERKRSFAIGIADCGSGLGTIAFPFFIPWIMEHFFSNDYKGILVLESVLLLMCAFFGLLMVPLPIELSEQRRARLKLRSEAKRQATNRVVLDKDNNPNQLITEQQSLPFLETSPPASLVKKQRRTSVDRRYTSPSFRLNVLSESETPSGGGDSITNSEHAWKSLSHLSTTYLHSITTIQNNVLYKGSLRCVPLSNALGDDDRIDKTVQSNIMDDDELYLETYINQNENYDKSIIRQLLAQINLKLLKNNAFALFTVSNFLSSLGFFVPYNFAHDLAKDANVIESQRKFVLMAIGFSTCIGHIIIGYLADQKWMNRLILYNATLIIAGISTIVAPLSGSNILYHISYASFFGFFSGGYIGLTSIITVDLVGLNKLSNGMGIILLFQGIATAIGTPVAGALRDIFETRPNPFLWSYFIFGGFVVLSGGILFAIPTLIRRQKAQQNTTKHQADINILSH